jgi:DNA-binding NarL/FixJ family response regulator
MRIVLADDAVVIRQGLARLLRDDGFDVIAEVGNAEGLVQAVTVGAPDVAVVDIRMPPTFTDEGLVAAERIHAAHPRVGVLVLSQHVDIGYAMKLLDGGSTGMGYLLKDRILELATLVDALRRVRAGGTVVDPELVRSLVEAPSGPGRLEPLTARERQVLALIAEGRTDRAIAQALVVAPKTVEAHVRSIFRKLDLPSAPTENRRVHAVLAYLQR